MTTSESKGRFFLQNESIRIDSDNESNRFESRIGMLYNSAGSHSCSNLSFNHKHKHTYHSVYRTAEDVFGVDVEQLQSVVYC